MLILCEMCVYNKDQCTETKHSSSLILHIHKSYNSLTTWIDIDKLLSTFGLDRKDILEQSPKVQESITTFSRRLPTYVTIKDVKKRWGNGQEDVYPVAQYEKLWGDMSSVDGVDCSYFVVSRQRGQQLKDPAQIDEWSRDGSAAYLNSLCKW